LTDGGRVGTVLHSGWALRRRLPRPSAHVRVAPRRGRRLHHAGAAASPPLGPQAHRTGLHGAGAEDSPRGRWATLAQPLHVPTLVPNVFW